MTHYLKLAVAYLAVIAASKNTTAEAANFNITNLADCLCRPIKPMVFNCTIDSDYKRDIYAGSVFNEPPVPGAVDCYFQKELTLSPNEEVQVNDHQSGVCNDGMNDTRYISLSDHNDNLTSLTTDINTGKYKEGTSLSIITIPSSFFNSSVAAPSEYIRYDATTGTCGVI